MPLARRWSRILLGAALCLKGLAWLDVLPVLGLCLATFGVIGAAGVHRRLAFGAASAFIWTVVLSGSNISHHMVLLGLLSAYAAATPSDDDAPDLHPAEILLMVQVTAVYLWGGLWKLNPTFLSGSVLSVEWGLSWLAGPSGMPGALLATAACATVVVEISSAVLLWTRRAPVVPVISVLAVMHLCMALTIGSMWRTSIELVAFALACASSFPYFLAVRAPGRSRSSIEADGVNA